MLTRDAILSADDIASEIVPTPEWGGEVKVRCLTGAERDAYEASIIEGEKVSLKNIRAKLARWCVVDDRGNQLFTDADIEALAAKNGSALARISDVAMRLNKMRKEDMEELSKNSGRGQTGAST